MFLFYVFLIEDILSKLNEKIFCYYRKSIRRLKIMNF